MKTKTRDIYKRKLEEWKKRKMEEDLKRLHRRRIRINGVYLKRMIFDTSSLLEASHFNTHIFDPEILNPLSTDIYTTEGIMRELYTHNNEIKHEILNFLENYAILLKDGAIKTWYKQHREAIEYAINKCMEEERIKGEISETDKGIITAALMSEQPMIVVSEDSHITEPLKEISENRKEFIYRNCLSGNLIITVPYKEIHEAIYGEDL